MTNPATRSCCVLSPRHATGSTSRFARARRGLNAIPDGNVVLHVIAPDAAQARTFTFPYVAKGQRSVQWLVGLTGADWIHGATMPLAWKLEILDNAGTV